MVVMMGTDGTIRMTMDHALGCEVDGQDKERLLV